jgi:hypothetical protein
VLCSINGELLCQNGKVAVSFPENNNLGERKKEDENGDNEMIHNC